MPSGSAATSPDWSAASVYVLNGSTTAPSLRKTTRNSIVIGLGFFSSLVLFLNNFAMLLLSLLDMMSPRSSARKLAPMDCEVPRTAAVRQRGSMEIRTALSLFEGRNALLAFLPVPETTRQ